MDLSLVTTQSLIDELSKRFDDAVILLHRNHGGAKKEDEFITHQNGFGPTAIGMMRTMERGLVNSLEWVPKDDEDDNGEPD